MMTSSNIEFTSGRNCETQYFVGFEQFLIEKRIFTLFFGKQNVQDELSVTVS